MVKLAFGYKRRVGKDTSCDYLIEKYGGVKLSFAEPLYKILNFAQEECNFEKTKDRKFLQFLGTEWARTINDNVWVNLLVKRIKELPALSNIFVSDLRFQNEFKVLKEHGFICIHLKNLSLDQPTKVEQLAKDGYSEHQSDVDLDNYDGWDYTIENFGSKENLYSVLNNLYCKCN